MSTEGLAYEATILLPEAVYRGEILRWDKRIGKLHGNFATLNIQITKGPFEGRKVFKNVHTSAYLGRLIIACGKSYSADTTVEQGLNSLIGAVIQFRIEHRIADGMTFTEVDDTSIQGV